MALDADDLATIEHTIATDPRIAQHGFLNDRIDRIVESHAALAGDMRARAIVVDERFAAVDDRFDRMDARMDRLDDRMMAMHNSLRDEISKRFNLMVLTVIIATVAGIAVTVLT